MIVWITKDLSAPRTGGCTWLLADTGETCTPYVNLHCVVLAGWDGDTCTIADPLQGRRRVDAETLAHIGEPFYRPDKARSREQGGAGLGLALCFQIAQSHGAALSFTSAPGAGTTAAVIFTA